MHRFKNALASIASLGHKLWTAGNVMPYRLTDPKVRIAAIGDIHGRADLLRALFARLDEARDADSTELVEIYLGDYVDRGPCSAEVIELLIERQRQLPSMICLKGNHEQMLLDALDDVTAFHRWLVAGGEATLAAFRGRSITSPIILDALRLEFKQILPEAHLAFLSGLPAIHARAGFLFVHAGIRPGVPIEDQPEADLLWIREPFLSSNADFGAIVVHGHSRGAEPIFRANRIGLDTGAYFSNVLTCMLISSTGAEIIQTGET